MFTSTKSENGARPVSYSAVSELFDIDKWAPKSREGYAAGSEWMYGKVPMANIKETHDEFIIELAVPGMAKKDLSIAINDHLVTIDSNCEKYTLQNEERYTKQEFNYNECSRSFILPNSVSEEGVLATCSDGLLTLTLPKSEDSRNSTKREIRIN